MARTLLQINVEYHMPLETFKAGAAHSAGPIAEQPGMLWKIWIFAEDRNEAGGIYLFESREAAQAYLDGDLVAAFKANPMLSNVTAKLFGIDADLTAMTRGPIEAVIRA